jgi:hypothetical protein
MTAPADRNLAHELERLQKELESLRQAFTKVDGQLASGGQLANEKLQGEIGKIAAETEKTSAEKRKLDVDIEKAILEKRKLAGELDPVTSNYLRGEREIEKLKAETDKLNYDQTHSTRLFGVEFAKAGGAVLAACVAIATFGLGFCTRQDERETRVRTDAARLVESLGGKEPATRITAAIGLRAYLKENQTRMLAISGLAYALGIELEGDVQQAIQETLTEAGSDAEKPIRDLLTRAEGEVRQGFSNIAAIADSSKRHQEEMRIKARQSAMITGLLALARIKSTDGAAVRPELSNHNFKNYPFYALSSDFRGALFRSAVVWGADFYKMDLSGADFSNAIATDAKFNLAQLASVNFSGADLQRAVFTGAEGLIAAQLDKAKTLVCAQFDPPLADQLKTKTVPSDGRICIP